MVGADLEALGDGAQLRLDPRWEGERQGPRLLRAGGPRRLGGKCPNLRRPERAAISEPKKDYLVGLRSSERRERQRLLPFAGELFLGHELRESAAEGVIDCLARRRQLSGLSAPAWDADDEDVGIEFEELRGADLDV